MSAVNVTQAPDHAWPECAFDCEPAVGEVELRLNPANPVNHRVFKVCAVHWEAPPSFWNQVAKLVRIQERNDREERAREARYEVATGRRWLK